MRGGPQWRGLGPPLVPLPGSAQCLISHLCWVPVPPTGRPAEGWTRNLAVSSARGGGRGKDGTSSGAWPAGARELVSLQNGFRGSLPAVGGEAGSRRLRGSPAACRLPHRTPLCSDTPGHLGPSARASRPRRWPWQCQRWAVVWREEVRSLGRGRQPHRPQISSRPLVPAQPRLVGHDAEWTSAACPALGREVAGQSPP